MNIKQAKESMKESFEEISFGEYLELGNRCKCCLLYGYKNVYFKPREKFPKVFEDSFYRITVNKDGLICIASKMATGTFGFADGVSLELLEQAMDESKRIRGLK